MNFEKIWENSETVFERYLKSVLKCMQYVRFRVKNLAFFGRGGVNIGVGNPFYPGYVKWGGKKFFYASVRVIEKLEKVGQDRGGIQGKQMWNTVGRKDTKLNKRGVQKSCFQWMSGAC